MDEIFKSARMIFSEAVEIDDPVEREACLERACGRDADLRQHVDELLRAHADAGNFLADTDQPDPKPPVTEKPGDGIGRYKLIERIGEGGCGIVYLAEQEEPLRRRVALKVIKLGMDSRSVIARFEAERQALALMDHPNIARVFDAGATDSGRPYFVMELVRGVRITEYCDENALSAPERLALFVLVCQAIQHAHQKGIIHRDIKPSNILVTVNDGVAVPKVIDFGIAKATEQKLTDKTIQTLFLEFLGTPAYMSPEQAAMTSLDIDTRSDIYSLGVLLYELLAGQPPFDGPKLVKSGFDTMRRTIAEEEPARPSTRLRQMTAAEQTTTARRRRTAPPKLIHLLSGDLDWVVMKCLEKDRARRYETANALATDVQRHLNSEPVLARPPSRLYRAQKLVRRHRRTFIASAALFVVLAAGLAASTWFFFRETAARQRESATRQVSEMGKADLATRTGHWREALVHWDAAERAGYRDAIDLGLKRAEAWIVLHDRAKAGAEFDKLLLLPLRSLGGMGEGRGEVRVDLNTARQEPAGFKNLGSSVASPDQTERLRRNAILMRVGEFQMFDKSTFQEGIQRVREALTNGLSAADEWLAKGLVATSTTNALAAFRRALELDPYLHSAHRHGLGLAFALGRHDELASHLRVAKALYPGDFSLGAIEVCELALHGRLSDAEIALAGYRNSVSQETYARLERGIRVLAKAVEYFDVEVYLGERTNTVSKSELVTEATQIFLARNMGDATNATRGSLPSLPCVEQGIRAGFEGLQSLALARVFGGASRTETALDHVREGCRHHPEALFPTFCGVFLDNQQPRSGPRDLRLLTLQSEMYQLGADFPSILHNLGRLARLLAVDVQEELARSAHTNAAAFRTRCVANLRLAALDPQLTPVECRSYSRWSLSLGELDLNRQFLGRWESLRPGDTNLLRHRVRLELASGAYGPALKLIDRALSANSDDKQAKSQRDQALRKIKELSNETVGHLTP